MIETYYDAIRATKAASIALTIKDAEGTLVTSGECVMTFFKDGKQVAEATGEYVEGVWNFLTPDLESGKYFYIVAIDDVFYSFLQPFYME